MDPIFCLSRTDDGGDTAERGIEFAEVIHHDAGGRCGRSVQARIMLDDGPRKLR